MRVLVVFDDGLYSQWLKDFIMAKSYRDLDIYKRDFIKFLIYSHSSNDETINHLMKIEQLYPELSTKANTLKNGYDTLGRKLNKFIEYVENNWKA